MENNLVFNPAISRFKEHRQMTKATILGNLLLALVFLMTNHEFLWQNIHVQISLLTAILIFVLVLFYSWKNNRVNLAIVAIYLGLFLFELYLVGIPTNPMPMEQSHGRGLLLGVIIMFVPWLYVGLRLAMILPLIQVTFSNFKLTEKGK